MEDQSMRFDVLIVGAGPSGLATAIRLMQEAERLEQTVSVCVLEKGAEVGAHIVSGCVLEPRALDVLLPDWRKQKSPIVTRVKKDTFYALTQDRAIRLPTPPQMYNRGNYIVSLSKVCRWLAEEAERLGVVIIPGYAAAKPLFNKEGAVEGVQTGDMGRLKDGSEGPSFEPGTAIFAKHTVLAEGCRGSMTEELIRKYDLRKNAQMQTYAIGVKEVWGVSKGQFQDGLVMHTLGWPFESDVYGGSFLYGFKDHEECKVAVGMVMGLDYANPSLDAHQELQRWKHHPHIKPFLQGGKCLAYAARALNEGGWQAIPTMFFPGGMLVGCAAGLLNVPKIKGTHTAMMSGIYCADALVQSMVEGKVLDAGMRYEKVLKGSWVAKELKRCRNIRPGFYKGLVFGLCNAVWETVSFGLSPWTLALRKDHTQLKPKSAVVFVHYPKPDGVLSFSKLESVRLTGTNHQEGQPCHLKLKNLEVPMQVNYPKYGGPEAFYCPAKVYEYVTIDGKTQLQINSQNCIHCKTCDIKDPTQNIVWVVPQGGDGPRYSET